MSSSRPAEPRRLTSDGKRKLAPVFQSAQEVAFAVHDAPTQVVIVRLRLEGGAPQRLHPGGTAHQFDPAFSRDGLYHAFVRSTTSPQLVLVIQDLRGKQEHEFRPRD